MGLRIRATVKRHPRLAAVVGIVVLVLIVGGLYWFAPWNLVVDRSVDEALPSASEPAGGAQATEEGAPTEEEASDAGSTAGEQQVDVGPVTVTSGGFRSLEHETDGTALVIELEDGSRFLRLEDLETSNGPDLRVILTDQPVSDDWHVWDDGEYVDLGALKGNLGSSNYEIPKGVDLEAFETAVIWCRRFSVGFAVAPLEPAS
jgi:hypothetical protein